jgi:preprotein translocase subunit SecE
MPETLVATLPGGDTPPPARRQHDRASMRQFFREVRDEMRQVAWPTRPEVMNYTTIVGTVLLLMIGLIFGLNYGCSKAVTWLFVR